MAKINWTLKKVKVSSLIPNERNPRIFRDKEMRELKDSMDKFGVAEPLVSNTDNVLIGGHARLKLLQQEGVEQVDCYFPDKKLSKKQADELMVRLNKNVAGVFDEQMLLQIFEAEDLFAIGFEPYELGIETPKEETYVPPQSDVMGEQTNVGDYLILQFESEESCNKARVLLNVTPPSRIVFEDEFWKNIKDVEE